MRKSVLSFALITALGATFASCDKQQEVPVPEQTAEVKIGMSVFSGKAAAQNASAQGAPTCYASADDVYFDGQNHNGINNIFVVPMKNDIAQKPVQLVDLAGNSIATTEATTLTVNSETNRFLVYANLRKSIVNGANFDTKTTFGINVDDEEHQSDLTGYYKSHKVYLFADANKDFKVARNEQWANVAVSDWTSYDVSMELGSEESQMNCIKIENVTYAVGTLAAAVYHGDYTDKKVYVGADRTGVELTEEWLKDNVALVGITVDKQYPEFDYLFNPKGNFIGVFEPIPSGQIKSVGSDKINFTNAAANAHTFVPVSPYDQDVVVNVVCRNNNAEAIVFGGDGTTSSEIPAGERFFLAAKLAPGNVGTGSAVFVKGYTTLLNATITNWEKATVTPHTSVDVQIGISVDLSWKEGVTYDEEI